MTFDFGKISKAYDAFEKDAVTEWMLGYHQVLRVLGMIGGKEILDYGCGTGVFSEYLTKHGARVTGVDISAEMLEFARDRKIPGIDLFKIQDADLRFLPNASMDAAVCTFVLCTIPSLDGMAHIMGEINRVLKPGGLLVVLNSNWQQSRGKDFVTFRMDHPHPPRSGEKVTVTLKPPKPGGDPILIEDYYWSLEDYASAFAQAGFDAERLLEPLGDTLEHPWLDEKTHPPFLIMVGKK